MKIEIYLKNGYPVLILNDKKHEWQNTVKVGYNTQRFSYEVANPQQLNLALQPKVQVDQDEQDKNTLLNALKEKPGQGRKTYAEATKLSTERVSDLLASLRRTGKIAMAGNKRSAIYFPVP